MIELQGYAINEEISRGHRSALFRGRRDKDK